MKALFKLLLIFTFSISLNSLVGQELMPSDLNDSISPYKNELSISGLQTLSGCIELSYEKQLVPHKSLVFSGLYTEGNFFNDSKKGYGFGLQYRNYILSTPYNSENASYHEGVYVAARLSYRKTNISEANSQRIGASFLLGYKSIYIYRLTVDLHAGIQYLNSDLFFDPSSYESNMLSYAYTGIRPTIALNIGFKF